MRETASPGWVVSATSIATPHNGTTLRDIVVNWLPDASTLAGLAVQASGTGGSGGSGSEFRLEQFGMKAGSVESIKEFIERTRSHPFWSLDNHDSAQWDLTPDGAAELNSWVKTSPDVYVYRQGSTTKIRFAHFRVVTALPFGR